MYKENAAVSKNTENITSEINYETQDIQFLNNRAKIFGHHIGSFPRELSFSINNYENFTRNSHLSYNLFDYQPGGSLNIDIRLLDEFGDVLKFSTSTPVFDLYSFSVKKLIKSISIEIKPTSNSIKLDGDTFKLYSAFNENNSTFNFPNLIIQS